MSCNAVVKMSSKKPMSAVFVAMSVAAFVLIYLTPPFTNVLFPAFTSVRETGTYPDGLIIRRTYTGVKILDEMCTGLAGFFGAAVDGHDEATRMFCLWFLPQLCGILVFLYWEAGRPDTNINPVALPTTFGILAQLVTAGVILPLYFAAHISYISLFPMIRKSNIPSRARALFPAVILGFLVPSAVLFIRPASSPISLDRKQIIAAIWQLFPVYVAIAYSLLSRLLSYPDLSSSSGVRETASPPMPSAVSSAAENYARQSEAFPHLKRAYILSGALSSIAHWIILVPSVFTSDVSRSFAQIFIPYPLHPYFGVPPSSLAPYRLSARLLFQHDWLTMTVAAFAFFGYIHVQLARSESSSGVLSISGHQWLGCMAALTVIGGPGAAIAWAAAERERSTLSALGKACRVRSPGNKAPTQEKLETFEKLQSSLLGQ